MTATYSARNVATIVRDVPIERITASTFNPRKHFDQSALEELAASLRQHGMIEPIVVRQIHTDLPATPGVAWYEIIAGERRWRASKLAGLETVPTRIMGQVDDERALQLALIENLQRQDLDPIEEAEGYHLLNHIVGMKQKQIAESVNRSQPAIANAMRLLDLPEDVQQRIRAGELSRSHGVAIAKYSGFPKVQSAIADYVVQNRMTSHQTEKLDLYNLGFLQAGVVKQVNTWHTPFDVEQCKICPFGAYRTGRHEGGLCLNPDHWQELAEAAEKDRTAKVAELIEATSEVIDLNQLKYDDYESTAYNVPPGCTEDCECRRMGLRSPNGELQPICIDPKRIKGLRRDHDKAKKKHRAELREKHLARLEERIDQIMTGVGSIELAVLAAAAFRTVSKPTSLKAAGERHGIEGPAAEKVSYGEGEKDVIEHLATLDPRTLVKFALEAVLRDDIADIYGEYRVNSARAEFYTGLYDFDVAEEAE